MTLITGFTCPPTIYFKFITKCDKCDYKVRQVLQSVTILLQSATGITKCDNYYKVRQYSGVEQSSCDAMVWAPATKRQNKMADVIVHYQRVEPKLYPPEGQPKSASAKFLANIFLILFL